MTTRRPQTTLLALTLENQELHALVVHRANGHVQARKSLRVSLALNPMTADPQLVGREIRNHLDQAGIRERHCVVGLPLQSAFSLNISLPDLPKEDLESFIQLEAERGFPYSPDTLAIGTSRCPGTESFATLVAIPRQRLGHLQRALQAAQLRPLSFTLAATSLLNIRETDPRPRALLLVTREYAELIITVGSGLAAVRSLDLHPEAENPEPDLDGLAREIRVTLGHLPESLAMKLERVEYFPLSKAAGTLAAGLAPRLNSLGLDLTPAQTPAQLRNVLPADAELSTALFLGAARLKGHQPELEFLPPKVKRWQQLAARVQARRLAWAGAAAALVALLVGGAFVYQHLKLSRLQRDWDAIAPGVEKLDALQGQIKRFRPWTDDPFRSLVILRGVTEAFPEEGVISAKRLEIRELSTVTLAGVARDNQAVLDTLDRLRGVPQVAEIKVDQLRGTPSQFTFNFNWQESRDR